jgi:hypothetical protein
MGREMESRQGIPRVIAFKKVCFQNHNTDSRYFFVPQWDKLTDISVWRKAAEQVSILPSFLHFGIKVFSQIIGQIFGQIFHFCRKVFGLTFIPELKSTFYTETTSKNVPHTKAHSYKIGKHQKALRSDMYVYTYI